MLRNYLILMLFEVYPFSDVVKNLFGTDSDGKHVV
jgi:hypothetical protein